LEAAFMNEASLDIRAKPTTRFRRPSFYAGMSVLLISYVIAGFWPKYFGVIVDPTLRPSHPGWIIHAHAAVFLGWMLIFVIQALSPWLGRTDLHLKLGLSMAGYGVFVILFGAWASIMLEVHRYSFTHDLNLSAMRLLISLETIVLFGSFLIAAIWYRKKPEIHKRLMVVATFSLAAPGISRVLLLVLHVPPDNRLLIQSVFLLPLYLCLAWDWRTRGAPHPVYFLGIAGNLALFNSGWFARTDLWQSIGRSLLQPFL
jgi:hypothetical protein